MSLDVPRTDEEHFRMPAPSWRHVSSGGVVGVVMCCPNGHECWLDHDIADDGRVAPSIECPEDGCDFHDFVRLLDWEPS